MKDKMKNENSEAVGATYSFGMNIESNPFIEN